VVVVAFIKRRRVDVELLVVELHDRLRESALLVVARDDLRAPRRVTTAQPPKCPNKLIVLTDASTMALASSAPTTRKTLRHDDSRRFHAASVIGPLSRDDVTYCLAASLVWDNARIAREIASCVS
jgi:hypothetical protein